MKLLLLSAMLFAFSSIGHAGDNGKYYEIKSVKIYEDQVSEKELVDLRNQLAEEVNHRKNSDDPLGDLDIVDGAIDKIFAIGSKIWKVVVDNQPVVNLSTQRVSALPKGAEDWLAMENWSDLEVRKFTAVYTNGFNMNVAKLSYLVTYTHGGSINGRGKYLSQVGFLVSNLDVAWGYTFDATAEVARVQNVGTKTDPIAAVELNLSWMVKTPLKYSRRAVSFYIRGDGAVTARGL